MRVLAISHERDAGPGVFGEAVRAAGGRLDVWHRAETDDLPGLPETYDAVISFGGAMHADQGDAHPWLPAEIAFMTELLERRVPLLGVCLGAQLLALASGGGARRAREPEIGWKAVELTTEGESDPLLAGLAPGFEAFEWHSYECVLPADAAILATSAVCVQAFRLGDSAWGIQFHAEVTAADARGWIEDYGSTDPDAVRIGLDQAALRAQTGERIVRWNELGRRVCANFLGAGDAPRAPHARASTAPPS